MSNYLQKIIYLSQSDYNTLAGGGTVTKNGTTLTELNDNHIYFTDGGIQLGDLDDSFILPVAHGGTGLSSVASGKILMGNGSNAFTTIDKASANTANTLVQRDASGDFSAGMITTTSTKMGNVVGSANQLINVQKLYPDNAGNLLLAYKQSGTGVTTSQWMVGTVDIQGVVRSNNTDLLHSRNGTNSVILDVGNYKTYTYALDGSNTGTKLQISTQSAAYTNGIQFMNSTTKKGSIGTDNNGTIGIYGTKIILRPQLDAATEGVEITTDAMYPTDSMTLGTTSNKWSTVYATTFDGALTGNANTATEFSSGTTVKLTGDTTGESSSSTKGWEVATTTKFLSGTPETSTAITTSPGTGKIKYSYNVSSGTAGLFSVTNNASSIITLNRHSGNYDSQLGFSSNGNIYYRNFSNAALNTTTAWKQIAFTDSNVASADTAETATNLSTKPSLAASGNNITVTAGGKTSDAFTVPYATSADNATSLTNFVVSTYTIAAGKGVRIKYPSHAPVLISCSRTSGNARLILIGGGYGEEGTTRNDFTEVVSPSESHFTWSMPQTTGYACTIEIMHHDTSATAKVWVETTETCTFTEITALTSTKTNRKLLHSSNYTDYTVTKTGSGASGTWGISITGSSTSCTGNAATATDIQTAGTTAQFYRGDNSWSNIIKQTANATLGIDTNLKIGTARKDLNFDITNGNGTGINDGYAGGITWGLGNAAYAGIYYQTSGSYGSRLIFGTTGSYANGAYARMIIQGNGNIGIGTLSPDTLLTVNGNAKATKFIGALQGNADTATSATSAATATNLASNPTITKEGTATINLAAETAYTLTVGGKTVVFKTPADSNTHSVTKLIAGGSSATANAAVSSGNVYLRLFDDSTHRNNIQLKAGTAMTITSDANGIITFTSSDTNNAAKHTLAKTTKYYITGTTSATTSTAGDSFDTGVYVTAVEGELSAVSHSYNVDGTEKAYTYYNTIDDSIDFVFI